MSQRVLAKPKGAHGVGNVPVEGDIPRGKGTSPWKGTFCVEMERPHVLEMERPHVLIRDLLSSHIHGVVLS